MCSVSSVVEKIPAPSNRILITAPRESTSSPLGLPSYTQIFFPLFVIKVIITLERNTRTYRNIYCIQGNPEAALDEEFHLQNCLTEISLKPERMLIRVCMFKV